MPVNVPAVAWESKLRQRYVDEGFGTGAFRLGQSFRLGPGTSIVVEAPGGNRGAYRGLGIVSSTSWDSEVERGTTLATIAMDPDGGPRWDVRYGTETYRRRATAEEVATLPSTIRPILERIPTDTGEVIHRYFFAHAFEWGEEPAPRRLEIRYTHDAGMWDVAEIVLLPVLDAAQ
jgi:hypothetical protein